MFSGTLEGLTLVGGKWRPLLAVKGRSEPRSRHGRTGLPGVCPLLPPKEISSLLAFSQLQAYH